MSEQPVSKLELYKVHITLSLRARFNGDNVEETRQLETMDDLWYDMTSSERAAIVPWIGEYLRPHMETGGKMRSLPPEYTPNS
ncbi:hypothetical protein LUCX_195 [Xanthomonas phage vB_XciM_LucasX]|nr:hypothetical protein LUCX_195 [Xanthomonas phage vB_XciM_LucasX]